MSRLNPPLTKRQINRIQRLRENGLTIKETMAQTGHSSKTVCKYAPGHINRIPVGPIRDVVLLSKLENQLTWSIMAITLWGRQSHNNRGDTTRLQRLLGVKPYSPSTKGTHRTAETINYHVAMHILKAAHVDPVDVGY